jgi:LacI family transcriptional regulator
MAKKTPSVTIRDLAEHAKVSPATVSRVINNSGYVSEETRHRVEQAVRELDYRPDAHARGLRGMPSGLVALIIPHILNVFYTGLAQIIENKLRQLGYIMLLGTSKDDPDLYADYLNHFWELRVDGIICVPPPNAECSSIIRGMVRQGMPIVEVNRQCEKDVLDSVVADNFQGACLGTEYLVNQGHQRIALIVGHPETTTGQNRIEGFRWVMTKAGLEVDPALLKIGEFSKEYGIQATEELLCVSPWPTAIFAASNRLLIGAMTALTEHQVRVPEDISIVAFDDSEWLSFWRPPITTVDVGVDEMGLLAVELLMRWIKSGEHTETPHIYSLSTRLIERQSCKRIGPPLVRQ